MLKWNEIFRCKDGVIYDNVIFAHPFIHLCYQYISLSTGELWSYFEEDNHLKINFRVLLRR